MSYEYSEDALVEAATQEVLQSLGWKVVSAWKKETFGETGLLGRDNKPSVPAHVRQKSVKIVRTIGW